jgi:hypothetical protein
MYSIPSLSQASHVIAHNKGTSLRGGTSLSIGLGSMKRMRDCAIGGYTVGIDIRSPSKELFLVERSKHHILAYDIEVEYMRPHTSTFTSPILYVCLACSCGYRAVVSRMSVNNKCLKTIGWECFEGNNNAQIAELTMELICRHRPIFSIGHNIYEFDNSRLACALAPNSRFRQYFSPTSPTLGKNMSSLGFIMLLPGINNMDTFRYIRKAMAQRFKSFALGNLAQDLGLQHKKLDTSKMEFSLKWYTRSLSNATDMIRYNMIDCKVTLDLCFSLDLVNQMIALCSITKSYILDVMLSSTGAIAASCLCNYALRQYADISGPDATIILARLREARCISKAR